MTNHQSKPPLIFLLPSILFIFSTPRPFGVEARTPIKALVAPITKDPLTSLYSLSFNSKTSFLLDLAGPLSWAPCPAIHFTLACNSTACSAANSSLPRRCRRLRRRRPCTCTVYPLNPVTGACSPADLTLTDLAVSATDGHHPTTKTTARGLISSCAPRSLLRSLPSAASGVAALGRSAVSLPAQLSSRLSLRTQFAICLPSTTANAGVAFVGAGPFYLLPPTSLEVTSFLSYTPLLKNPTVPASAAYYISLVGIAVNGVAVRFLRRTLEFDSLGHGGVALSTAAPYTALRSHIYRPFIESFARATSGIPRAPRVGPFGLCFNSTALWFTRVGYAVAQVDLMLPGGKNWTVFGANSLKQVGPETACLAFVDGGARAEQAVVIGGYQMEDNFLLFDVGRSRLGFSSSLLFFRTTCGNFNFTSGV